MSPLPTLWHLVLSFLRCTYRMRLACRHPSEHAPPGVVTSHSTSANWNLPDAAGSDAVPGHMVFAVDGSGTPLVALISRCLEGCVCGGHVDPRHRALCGARNGDSFDLQRTTPQIPPDQVRRHRRRQGLSARLQRGLRDRCPSLPAEERRPHPYVEVQQVFARKQHIQRVPTPQGGRTSLRLRERSLSQ